MHHSTKGLYNKPFPYFDVLGPVFGKDVANGAYAEGPSNDVEAMNKEDDITKTKYGEDELFDFVDETQQTSTNHNSAKEIGDMLVGQILLKKG